MITGGIKSCIWTALYVVPQGRTVNGELYWEEILPLFKEALLDKTMFPSQELSILMQDGATPHTAKPTIRHIQETIGKVWTDWPGNSPDLNPIENVWALLQESVFEEPRPRSRESLIDRIREKWNSFPQEYFASLIESFPSPIKDCLDANGGSRKY